MKPFTEMRPFIRTVVVVLLASIGLAQAQAPESSTASTEPVQSFISDLLDAVQSHPSLRAAGAAVTAAELQVQGARQPVELQLDASLTRLSIEDDPSGAIPQPNPQASLQIITHPFLYGDLADRAAQLEAELLRARLSLREASAQIETQAIDAAAGVLLGEAALGLAERAAALARSSEEITGERYARGAARDSDVVRARQETARADAEVAAALDRLSFARLNLSTLVGRDFAVPPALVGASPVVPLVDGEYPAVTRALLDISLAEIGLDASRRNLLPVGQASYAWNLGSDQGAISVGIETRTLSPSLGYRTSTSASGGANGGMGPPTSIAGVPPMQIDPPSPRVAGQLTVGVSLTLSPERFLAVDAAGARLQAAEAGYEVAIQRASLLRRSLANDVAAAERELELAGQSADLARADRHDVARRVELGLAAAIELQQSDLAVLSAELTFLRTQYDFLRTHLNAYADAAIPISEVLK